MDEQQFIGVIRNGNAFLQVPVEHQMSLLGLDKKTIKGLEGKAGLDIGCGNGALVEELRKRGVLFEGIDPIAPRDSPYLISQNIYGMFPMDGAILREDNSYDIITAFQCSTLNRAFTIGGILRGPNLIGGDEEDKDFHNTRVINAHFIIYEAARVAKPNSRIVVYPCLTRLEETMGHMLKMSGIRFHTEKIDKNLAEEYMEWEFPGEIPTEYFKRFGLYERTILVKEK